MDIAHRKSMPQSGFDYSGCVRWLLPPSFPTSFIGNPGSLFVPDGSPITNVGDDGEGMCRG